MNVVFRADSSASIGAGHVSRCLALAIELAKQGDRCVFACRPAVGDLISFIRGVGFDVVELPDATASPEAEALAISLRATNIEHVDWLVVDHYGLDHAFESACRTFAQKIAVIDDLASRRHDCDILLDQNMGTDSADYAGLVLGSATVLAGPRFALLRGQFGEATAHSRWRDGSVSRVLVCFGGSDPTNETEKVLVALVMLGDIGIAVDVVLPEVAPYRDAVATRAAKMSGVTLHGRVEDMAALMSAADLMIGAGGVTLLERAAVGLPSISLRTADNQTRAACAAATLGTTRDLGPSGDVTPGAIAAALGDLLGDAGVVRDMAVSARAAAGPEPGSGPRVLSGLMHCISSPGAQSRLRPLRADDRPRLRMWRNSDRVRLAMSSQHLVAADEHDEWFDRALAEGPGRRFVYECGGVPLGFVTFSDVLEHERACTWGFYMGEPWAPRGSGGRLGMLALDTAFTELGLDEVRAEVLSGNASSLAFHARMGFRETGAITGSSPDDATVMTWRTFALTKAEWAVVRGALVETYFGAGGAS